GWGEGLVEARPDISKEQLAAFGQKMWGGDFVLNQSEDFAKTVQTPLLVMPGNDPAHPRAIGMMLAELLPNATLLEGWKDSPEAIASTVETVREYLKANEPKGAAVG